LVGPTGPNGNNGNNGQNGQNGINGDTGPAGPAGPAGDTGATGAAGPSGVGGLIAYFWGDAADVLAVIAGNDGKCLYDFASPLNTALLSKGVGQSGDITVNAGGAGFYKVFFAVDGVEPNAFNVCINGTPQAGSTYGSGAGTQQNRGMCLIAVADGDVVSVRSSNVSPFGPITLALAGTTTNTQVVVSVLFEKFASLIL
jgi:hypothetical protein